LSVLARLQELHHVSAVHCEDSAPDAQREANSLENVLAPSVRHQPSWPVRRTNSQLTVWRLADELRVELFKLTRRQPFNRDFKHRAQAEDAIDSVCRNIAEGFGCESHAEFARFLEISRRSLNELLDSLRSAQLKEYVTPAEADAIHALSRRLYPAMGRFIAYLKRTPNTPRTNKRRDDRRT
jgi:four helix bundle protein